MTTNNEINQKIIGDNPNLKRNVDNLVCQIILDAISDNPNYLETDDGKYWLDALDVNPRRLLEAIKTRKKTKPRVENVVKNRTMGFN